MRRFVDVRTTRSYLASTSSHRACPRGGGLTGPPSQVDRGVEVAIEREAAGLTVIFFAESSTFGTILVLLVYGLSNLALRFYYKKHHPDLFNAFRHGVLAILGLITILVPYYYLAKPAQLTPYNWYPYMALGVVVLAVIYAAALVNRDPSIGDRIGSIVADE